MKAHWPTVGLAKRTTIYFANFHFPFGIQTESTHQKSFGLF